MNCGGLAISLFAVTLPAAGFASESFDYQAHWRLWIAGDVRLSYPAPANPDGPRRHAELTLTTRGFVRTLYSVDNHYSATYGDGFCAESSMFRIREGRKRREVAVTYQQPPGKASLLDRDLVRDAVVEAREIDVPPCVHDELSALARLRGMPVEPGQRLEFAVSNGKKSVVARVDVQEREQVRTPAGQFDAVRCEVFLFNGVLYRRKGRLFVWLTDDERHVPVRIRVKLPFYLGTITLDLVGQERP